MYEIVAPLIEFVVFLTKKRQVFLLVLIEGLKARQLLN